MKTCTKCGTPKDETSFAWKSKAKGTLSPVCRECHAAYHREHYLANKQKYVDQAVKQKLKLAAWLREQKTGPCTDCGVAYPYYVMDFDHRDPATKSANISQMAVHGNKTAILAEIAKCDLVCSNCHRERTHGGRLDK